MKKLFPVAIFLTALAIPAYAQNVDLLGMQMGIQQHDPHVQNNRIITEGTGSGNPSALAFMKIGQRHGKLLKFTGNTDQDFVNSIAPQQQATIDMAKVEMESGDDAELKDLAQRIIKSHEEELDLLKKWREKNQNKAP